jgi:type IV secretory pathway TraG/TraD family ATPase VirD4
MATSTRPLLLTVLALVVAIEALGVSVYAAWYGAQFFVTQTGSLGGALFLLGLFILIAVWLWALTVGLLRMRTFTRAGTLVWQTIQVVVGVSMISAEGDWLFVGLGMIIFGVLAGAITFAPSVVAVIARKPE